MCRIQKEELCLDGRRLGKLSWTKEAIPGLKEERPDKQGGEQAGEEFRESKGDNQSANPGNEKAERPYHTNRRTHQHPLP